LARWVRRRDRAGRVLAFPSQRRGALVEYGISPAEAERAAWAIAPDARRWEGAAAINRVLEVVGGPWALLARAYRLPALAAAEEAFYRWFAQNRRRFHRFGSRPECDEPESDCV